MAKPLPALPERELCAYEKIREDNIMERESAMAECGFFNELRKTKIEIGLVDNSDKNKYQRGEKLMK